MESIKKTAAFLWGGLGNFVTIGLFVMSFAVPAWAVSAAGIMIQYQPFSWVVAGFLGVLAATVTYALAGLGRNLALTVRARRQWLKDADRIDPMAGIFIDKRIRVMDLVNPYDQVVIGKKFIRCEIIGPANVVPLIGAGKFIKNHFFHSDSIEMRDDAVPSNAIAFSDCDFEECKFFKVSLLFQSKIREDADKFITGMNWITEIEQPTLLIEDQSDEKTGFGRFIRRIARRNGERRRP